MAVQFGNGANYIAHAQQAYCENPVAQRAVRMITDAISGAVLKISSPEIAALIDKNDGGFTILEDVSAHFLLHGNAFIHVQCDYLGRISALYALRPDRVKIIAGDDGWPVAYQYQIGQNVSEIAAYDEAGRPQIIHLRGFSPHDDHYGTGCLAASMRAVAVHNAATKWNEAFLDNAARPSGALIYDPGDPTATLTSEQFDRLKSEMEAGFSGAYNAGRPLLLEGGLKWQSLSMSPADMDFVALKAASAREISLAFGVPPMLMGLPGDNSYANYKEANRALWRLTLIPMCNKIFGAISAGLNPWVKGAKIELDLDMITALAEDREKLWAQVSSADFLSKEEKRAMLGLTHLCVEAGDE
ncbi:phage portal protein [Sphingorhabdus lutea]|uniref:Phage portal protein n=2 Tax=Sphingorhabdus lutea TaxID=1913578 RepID=A0A1L3JFH9_9SPHN|nr:phage portal protein [Sphingorhabdus lutea]